MGLSVPQALQLLHLEPGATRKQIRAAYKRLALQLHPDKQIQQRQQQSADATAAFAQLAAAYSLLIQGYKHHTAHHQHDHEQVLQPFETAYATGTLFSEQLVDEAVLVQSDPADIWNLQLLTAAAAEGQLAQHLAANPPSAADEQLWKQLYTRLELRQQARHKQQQQQQQQQGEGVGIGELLTDLLLRPSGPLFVEDSECESGSGREGSSEQGASATVHLQHSSQQQQQQQQQHLLLAAGHGEGKQQKQAGSARTDECAIHPSQQQPSKQQIQLHQPGSQQQEQQPGRPSKQLRHGWGFYWMWLRRALLAKALLSVLSSGLKAKLYEHHFPKPLPLPVQ